MGGEQAGGRKVLEGAFALVEALSEDGEAGLTRLAEATGLPKATAYRLLEQLTGLGAVAKVRGRYRVGPRIGVWGQTWLPGQGLVRAARGPMRALARATATTIGVVVPAGERAVLIGGVAGRPNRLVRLDAGTAWSRATAAGKALVGPVVLGPGGVGAPVFDREENMRGICCAAVPFDGGAEVPVAALVAITDPTVPLPQLAAALARTATAIQGEWS
ncbi:DNA-binding IclR family transcriptional regulator [Actinokineospora baliensis]|uniref:helix-turn-helix domain-containing protein n=1 Tax=Actinokineospora baliensis TaxID=547056 RepID=UPI00195A0520|nr:helix-turn-helix domain-containing protein [Actinokineospora baliensis]MBM7774788.1 DNA-binding IclR family transcriptional regulator [Actinokineospora baliensis]